MQYTKNENDIYKKTLKLAVPMMIQSGITNAVGLVDNLMVGSLGSESITGVSIVVQLIFVFNLAIFGGLSGPGIYGAQYYGSGDKKGFRNVFRLKCWISFICFAVGLSLFFFKGSELIKLYLHSNDGAIDPYRTLELAMDYLKIMLWTLAPFAITQIYAGSLRETDESIKPMVAGIISVAVDIIFNYLLIYGKFGFPQMGVKGAAVATVMARIVEMAVVVIWTHMNIKKHEYLQQVYSTLIIPLGEMKTIVVKSIPIFLNEFLWAGGIAVLVQCYSLRGLQVIAGINISNAICNLLNVVFIAMGGAAGIIVGQYLGASKFQEAKENSQKLMIFTGVVCGCLTVILIFLSGYVPQFYKTTAEARYLGRWFIVITALFFPLQGYLNVMYFTLRSGGKTIITFLFDSVFSWCVTVTCAYFLCKYTNINVLWIYTIVQAIDFIKVGIGYVLIQKGVWITNLVEKG